METKYTLEERLAYAEAGRDRAQAALDAANVKSAAAREMGGGIPGFGGSGNQRAAQQVRRAWSSADHAYAEATEKLDHYTSKARGYSLRIAERDRVRLGAVDVAGAKYVRTVTGWRKVVRVSAKSVSVESGYSWVDRIPLAQILEARAA